MMCFPRCWTGSPLRKFRVPEHVVESAQSFPRKTPMSDFKDGQHVAVKLSCCFRYANAHPSTVDSAGVEHENVRLFLQQNRWRVPSAGLVGRKGNAMTMKHVVLKYPTWQEPYRA